MGSLLVAVEVSASGSARVVLTPAGQDQTTMPTIKTLFILNFLVGVSRCDAAPEIHLADFDDLFRLATEGAGEDRMQDREDRSLLNSYPFNQVPRGSPSDTSPLRHLDNHQDTSTISLGSALFHQSSKIQAAAQDAFSNIRSQARHESTHTQSLRTALDKATAAAKAEHFSTASHSQKPAPLPAYTSAPAAPAPASTQFSSFPVVAPTAYRTPDIPSISVPDDTLIINSAERSNGQCPTVTTLASLQCQGAVNSCWSVGQPDVDCPGNALCCFDGCANVCLGQVRAVVRPSVKLPSVSVNPNRRRNPAQRRRKPAGQTFEAVAAAGQRCIDKVEQVEEIEYDEIEECNHSYDKKCHTSYSTEYDAQQEEECDDNYKKACDITYSPHAQNVTVKVCMTPLVKDCNLSGPEVCRTEYISECWTKNDPHIVVDDVADCRTEFIEKCVETQSGYVTEQDCKKWPKERCTIKKEQRAKFNPVTKCEKVPQELCGPSGCGFVPGPEECHEEVKTVVTDIPEEVCDLTPQRKCSHVTKLVPKLTPVEECVDVPKEICQKTKGNPRTVLKNVTKKWCYTPSEESGLL